MFFFSPPCVSVCDSQAGEAYDETGWFNKRERKSSVWLIAAGQTGALMMLRDKPLDTFHLSLKT